MAKFKNVLVALCAFGLISSFYIGCPSPTPNEGGNESTTDGGGKTETAPDGTNTDTPATETPAEKEETGPITMTFTPAADAEIGVSGEEACITVKFSHKPCSKGREAKLLEDGKTVDTPVSFEFDPKDRTIAKICALSVLQQEVKYNLTVKVRENTGAKCGEEGTEHTGNSSYKTKAPYKNDTPPPAGLGINLRLDNISKPSGVGDLINGLNPADIPPILVTLHSRDDGQSGNLTFIGGLGKAPPGGKPHEGKDIIDTDGSPVSLALIGKFNGRAFYVGPTTFLLAISGFAIRIDNFSLTGVFTADGKNVEFANLTGIIDPEFIQKQFGLDICALLAGECFKGPDGKDRVLIAGTVKGVPNPLPFSAFVTSPVYLSTDIATDAKAKFYTTTEVKKEDITFTLSTCKGSTDEQKPCDTSKEAKVEPVAGDGTIELDPNGKEGTYTPAKLEAGTWHKLELETKDANGTTFKTFTLFKTQ